MELKKEIYIPIEIKPREFVSQLLLSGELAKKGMRVYIGSKSSVDNLIENKKNKNGVYLYKGGGGSINKFKKAIRKVKSIAVLDQEIAPKHEYEISIKNRFTKGSLKYVSRLYYIGFEAKKAAINVLEDIKPSQIKTLGWPRVDLWKPSLHHIWNDEIKDIKNRYPEPFLLFTSDFGCNTKTLLEERCLAIEKRGRKKSKEDILWFRSIIRNNYDKYKEFIEFLTLLDKEKDVPLIIIRPHPAEDHYEWKNIVKNLSKIKVIYEGDVSPWLLASEGLIHRGCTSAIEATIARKKVAFLSDFSAENVQSLTYVISPKITNIDLLKDWINSEAKLALDNPVISKLIEKHIFFPKTNAVYEIAKDLDDLAGDPVNEADKYKQLTFLIFFKSFLKKIINRIYKKPNYVPKLPKKNKMQNGINIEECTHYLSLMYPSTDYLIEEPASGLIKIECLKV